MEQAENLPHKEVNPVSSLTRQALVMHRDYDQKKWEGKPSFHNEEHIKRVLSALKYYFQETRKGKDPLNLIGDLSKWNEQHPGAKVKKVDELHQIMKVALAYHDLGNFAYHDQANNTIIYLDQYCADQAMINGKVREDAQDAESRSIGLIQAIIEQDREKETLLGPHLPLIEHIINQTRYGFGENEEQKPFAVFVRVIDQVANNLLLRKSDLKSMLTNTIGLMLEQVRENPEIKISPRLYFNFAAKRLKELVPDDQIRRNIYSIFWDNEQLEIINEILGIDLPEEEQSVLDWLSGHQRALKNEYGITFSLPKTTT